MRQLTGPEVMPADLKEAEAHQIEAERDAAVDDPARNLEIRRDLIGTHQFEYELRAHGADNRGEQRATEQAEQNDALAPVVVEPLDQHVDADMDAGAHAIGGAELRHPDEHVDAEFLRTGEGDPEQIRIKNRNTDEEAMHHGDERDHRRAPHQARDDDLLEPVENA